MDSAHFSLADLESYDPYASQGNGERRFLCPICGDDKPKDASHRSLCVSMETGAYLCHRCGESGKIRDKWEDRPPLDRRARASSKLRRAFELPAPQEPAPVPDESNEWNTPLHNLRPLASTPGAAYLLRRGIATDVAEAAGVRFSPNWLGRPAVVFLIHDYTGKLVAAQGRYTHGHEDLKVRTVGSKSRGVFATRGVFAAPCAFVDKGQPIIITEAPLDALSLAVAGYPAIALCGKDGPLWLPKACAFRRVLVALDADTEGEKAANNLIASLLSYGARAERLRPEGAKDWNELLQKIRRNALASWLAVPVLMD